MDEDSARNKSLRKSALFLVVYAPERSVIDVWAMQQGPKVASINLSEAGRLLYSGHVLVGQSGVSKPCGQAPLLFLRDNGIIMEIEVPFHCILT